MKIAQFLLTRFNPAVRFASEELGTDVAWLNHRFKLFEKICLPSVAAQSEKDFLWILLMSNRTPGQFITRLVNDLAQLSSPSTLLLVAHYAEHLFPSAIGDYLDPHIDRVVTTRLDNDDAICRDYLADVRSEARGLPRQGNFVINFRRGCQAAKDGIFPRDSQLNPFLSVVSSPGNLSTAYSAPHFKMARVGEVIDKTCTRIRWIQVIHHQNVQNRLRASDPSSQDLLGDFSLARDWRSCL